MMSYLRLTLTEDKESVNIDSVSLSVFSMNRKELSQKAKVLMKLVNRFL